MTPNPQTAAEARAFVWDDQSTAELKLHWEAGKSCSRIGALLGISKNAVIGKARRMNLPYRPSSKGALKGGQTRKANGRMYVAYARQSLLDKEAELRKAWSENVTIGDLCRKFHVNKTPLYKVVKELNLPLRGKGYHSTLTRKESPAGLSTPRIRRVQRAPAEPIPATAVGLMERTGCCFPVNEGGPYLFCNAPKEQGSSYCPHHAYIMFAPAPKPVMKSFRLPALTMMRLAA